MLLDMTNQYGDTIGGRIHWLRKNRGLKIVNIAEQLSLQSSHLSSIENNKVGMSVDTLCRIADILDSTTDFILLRTDYPDTHELTTGSQKEAPTYFSDEADEAATLIDGMRIDYTRKAALSGVQTWAQYEAELNAQNVERMTGLLALVERIVGSEKRQELERALIEGYVPTSRPRRKDPVTE